MGIDDLCNQGVARARRELALGVDAVLSDAEWGVAAKYALAAGAAEHFGGETMIRRAVRDGALRLADVRQYALALLPGILRAGTAAYLEHPLLRARLVELALDNLLSERLAPEILLLPDSRTLPADLPLHALLFSAINHSAHEYYPLLVDALAAGRQAVAAHEDWLAAGTLRRCLLLDAAANRLLEVDLDPPAAVATAQVLALNLTEEAASHRRIEAALAGVPCANPYAGACRLDDKVWTTRAWQAAGLEVPAFLAFARDTADEVLRAALAEWLGTHTPRLVVKPADGTEGREVALLDFRQAAGRAACFAQLQRLLAHGPALVMEERGDLRYAAPGGAVRFAIRLNVCWDGRRARAESGYAQSASVPDGIASAGRGGQITPLADLWQRLHWPDGTPYCGTVDDWRRVMAAAEAGAQALALAIGPAMPRLIGVDLLLDGGDTGLLPVLLEANPRPAGMSHACFVTADGPTDEPGVTRQLWRLPAG